MKLSVLFLMSILVSFTTAQRAHADGVGVTVDCSQTFNAQTYEAIATPLGQGAFSARLLIAGKEQKALGPCEVMTRASTKYVRCAFEVASGAHQERFELYPISQTSAGVVFRMHFINWLGDVPTVGALDNCIE